MKKRSGFIAFLINSETKREKVFRSAVATSFVWMFLGPSLAAKLNVGSSDSFIKTTVDTSIVVAMIVFFVGFIVLAILQIRRNNRYRSSS